MAIDVPTIITSQQSYVTDWKVQADSFINAVAQFVSLDFTVDPIPLLGYSWSNATQDAEARFAALKPARPAFAGITGTVPTAPTFDFSSIVPVHVQDFLNTSPVLDLPVPPSSNLPNVPTAPSINDIALPDAPVYTIPATPAFSIVQIPVPPSIVIPDFTSTLPIDDLVAPSNNFSFFEQAYQSAVLDELQAEILDNLQNGGYGINPEDESALYERARSRAIAGAQTKIEEAFRVGAQRSFPQPYGEIFINVERAQQDLQNSLNDINRDIVLKRADLFVDNRKFTIEQARELEQVLISYHTSLMERTLNAAKVTLDASISIFTAQVSRYNVRLEAYRTDATVFEAKIRAALGQIEIYRTTVEGKKLELEAQRSAIEIYRAQLAGIESVVNIFRTRMDAANIQATIERTKFEAFRASIDAFAQQVQAKTAEFGMYEARIRGETAKVTVFSAQVAAYNAQVSSSKTVADIQVANLHAEVEQAQSKLAAYNGQIEQFKTSLSAQIETIRSNSEVYRADISAFSTSVDALRAAFTLELTERDTTMKNNIAVADVKVRTAIAHLQAQQNAANLHLEAAKFGATFYGNVTSAALNSINTLATQIQSS